MKTLQEQYNLIKEGKGDKNFFMKSALRQFPNLLNQFSNFDQTITILSQKGIISEVAQIGGVVTTPAVEPDWIKIFKQNVSEGYGTQEAKATEKKPTEDVTDMEIRGYDYKTKENRDNLYGQEFLVGYYSELKDPKNTDKDVEDLLDIVEKNLKKDSLYYTKNGQFGTKEVGYTDKAPSLGIPKEAKGKHKSSGYGDLNESLKENKDFKGTGLIIVGSTQLDNNAIGDMLDETDYYGVWDAREGYWFFPEEEETLDSLEMELEDEFNQRGINARFEAQI